MSEEEEQDIGPTIVVKSSRFGDLTVPADCVIEFPSGMIGFPKYTRYIMLDHSPPFSWLQSLDSPDLAFVVVDGFEFGDQYSVKPPYNEADIALTEEDEYAILVIVTVRSDPRDTTANLKAPLFVNLKNKRGVQIIFDDAQLSTRFSLWVEEEEQTDAGEGAPVEGKEAAAPEAKKDQK